ISMRFRQRHELRGSKRPKTGRSSRRQTGPHPAGTRFPGARACPAADAPLRMPCWTCPAATRQTEPVSNPLFALPARVVLELRVLADESQPHGADRPVALLADDDLGGALVDGIGVVDLVPIDEDDDVGVLLDRARVVTDDSVGEPGGMDRNGEVEYLFLAIRFDCDDPVPEQVGTRP